MELPARNQEQKEATVYLDDLIAQIEEIQTERGVEECLDALAGVGMPNVLTGDPKSR